MNLNFLIFVAVAFFCWGVYGPVLHQGQMGLGDGESRSLLRPFICVGVAYFVIAVVFPLIVLYRSGEKGHWSIRGIWWSFAAGCLGALGALGIIIAFKFRGAPVFVMPLVFGCAPVINTFVSMMMNQTLRDASKMFYVGVALVALGAAGVMYFKPSKPTPDHSRAVPAAQFLKSDSETSKFTSAKFNSNSMASLTPTSFQDTENKPQTQTPPAVTLPGNQPATGNDVSPETQTPAETTPPDPKTTSATPDSSTPSSDTGSSNFMMIVFGIALTALCWGAYGPILHAGQAAMGQSRFRAFLCVGLAYFALAVVIPVLLSPQFPEPGGWNNFGGIMWSLLGGAAGAGGALGIIYAFNSGGKPVYVMPLVFGFAPVVNTFTEITTKNLFDQIPTPFYASLLLVILGACTVLICAPKGHAKPAPPAPVAE